MSKRRHVGGAMRLANAVTNLRSLWGYARTMGLRHVENQETRITKKWRRGNILDQYAGVDQPTRLAHFNGSPNGQYKIIEKMSQQATESIYI
jgi:hypothetical protein